MDGIPATLATRADYENIHQLAKEGAVPKEPVINHWQSLDDGQRVYMFDRTLEADEAADGLEPDYRVIEDEETRRQFRLTVMPNSKMKKLGYSESIVRAKITELEAM